VARAEASVKDADRGLARAQELFAKNYVSQADLDAATVAVELRKADLRQARAQLESAQVDLAHATIRSPIDGVVISRSIDLGQTVAASLQAPQLFVIANDLSQMQVESRIDEADIGQMRSGLPVTFTVDAFPDRTFTGQVAQVRLEPIVESGVVSYTTVIHTRNPDLQLRPGMTANVSVLVERRDDVLRVPNAALRFRPPTPTGGRERSGSGGEARAATRVDVPGNANAADTAGAGMRRGRGQQGEGGGPGGDLVRGRAAGRDARGLRTAPEGAGGGADDGPGGYRPGAVYVLKDGKPERIMVRVGITDGSFTEVRGGELKPGAKLIVGSELTARNSNLQPPPGMGGPQFRGPGGGGRR
jgi:HlyD family secretion protein